MYFYTILTFVAVSTTRRVNSQPISLWKNEEQHQQQFLRKIESKVKPNLATNLTTVITVDMSLVVSNAVPTSSPTICFQQMGQDTESNISTGIMVLLYLIATVAIAMTIVYILYFFFITRINRRAHSPKPHSSTTLHRPLALQQGGAL